jgi:hypothetical protein
MPTAFGTIMSTNGSKFVAIFIIDEIQYIYAGTLGRNTGPFTVNRATLTFNSTNQLSATRSFTGQVGISRVSFKIDNGPDAMALFPSTNKLNPRLGAPSVVLVLGPPARSVSTALLAQNFSV